MAAKDTLPARIKAHNARRGQTVNDPRIAPAPFPRIRERALELAIAASGSHEPADTIIKTADTFLVFLNGEAANG